MSPVLIACIANMLILASDFHQVQALILVRAGIPLFFRGSTVVDEARNGRRKATSVAPLPLQFRPPTPFGNSAPNPPAKHNEADQEARWRGL